MIAGIVVGLLVLLLILLIIGFLLYRKSRNNKLSHKSEGISMEADSKHSNIRMKSRLDTDTSISTTNSNSSRIADLTVINTIHGFSHFLIFSCE